MNWFAGGPQIQAITLFTIQSSILNMLTALAELAKDLALKLMVWVFDFFTDDWFTSYAVPGVSEMFLEMLGREAETAESVVTYTEITTVISEDIFTQMFNKIFIPLAIILAVLIFTYHLFKSIVSDKGGESPGRMVFRAVGSVVLIISITSLISLVTDFSLAVQNVIAAIATEDIGTIDENSFENIESMVEEIIAGDSEAEESRDAARAMINDEYYAQYQTLANNGNVTDWADILSNYILEYAESHEGYTTSELEIYLRWWLKADYPEFFSWLNEYLDWYESYYGESRLISDGWKSSDSMSLYYYANYWLVYECANPDDYSTENLVDYNGNGIFDDEDMDEATTIILTYESDALDAEIAALGVTVLSVILALIISVKFFTIVSKYVSKYVQLVILIYLSPIAAATVAGENTADIFKAYVKLVVTVLVNLNFAYLMLNFVKVAVVATFNTANLQTFVVYYFVTMGLITLASDPDPFLEAIGLRGTGIRGSEGRALNMVGMMVARSAVRTATDIPVKAAKAATGAVTGAVKGGVKAAVSGTGAEGAWNDAKGAFKNAPANMGARDLMEGSGGDGNTYSGADTSGVKNEQKNLHDNTRAKFTHTDENGNVTMTGQENDDGTFSATKREMTDVKGADTAAGVAAMAQKVDANEINLTGENGAKAMIKAGRDKNGNPQMDAQGNALYNLFDKSDENNASKIGQGLTLEEATQQAAEFGGGGFRADETSFWNGGKNAMYNVAKDGEGYSLNQGTSTYSSIDDLMEKMEASSGGSGKTVLSNDRGYSKEVSDAVGAADARTESHRVATRQELQSGKTIAGVYDAWEGVHRTMDTSGRTRKTKGSVNRAADVTDTLRNSSKIFGSETKSVTFLDASAVGIDLEMDTSEKMGNILN